MIQVYQIFADKHFTKALSVEEIEQHNPGLMIAAVFRENHLQPYVRHGVESIRLDVCDHHPKFTLYCGVGRRIVVNLASKTARVFPADKTYPLSQDVWRCARIHWETFKPNFPRIRPFPAEKLWSLKGQELEDGRIDYGYTAEIDE